MEEHITIYQKHSVSLHCQDTGITPQLRTFPRIKVALFDLYGTLFISGSGDIGLHQPGQKEELLRTILRELFSLEPPSNLSLSDQLTAAIQAKHLQIKSELDIDYPEIDIREQWQEILAPYIKLSAAQIETLAVTYEARTNPVWPMPNFQEFFTTLAEKNIELGIISNAQFYTHALFPTFSPKHTPNFNPELCLYSYQEQQAKPGLHLYQKMASRLAQKDIKPEETLYLGNDMKNDIHPANEVGFQTVLFAGDNRSYRPRPERNYPPADAIITDLLQFLELLA